MQNIKIIKLSTLSLAIILAASTLSFAMGERPTPVEKTPVAIQQPTPADNQIIKPSAKTPTQSETQITSPNMAVKPLITTSNKIEVTPEISTQTINLTTEPIPAK